MQDAPLVSIIITNYNYGRFVAAAIDSALQQRYQPVEVIVVDDGSTDQSRPLIAGYGARIVPVWQANGGQASSFNAGFAQSHGALVLFLDADDVLLPDTVERVVRVFQAQPLTVKVQYRLELIDAGGKPLGRWKPPQPQPMPSGDLRRQVLSFPDDIAWQATSGNAFSAAVLNRILPMPEEAYRICADYYLCNLPPLFGRIISLDEVGGYYRVHGANNYHTSALDLDQTRQIIMRSLQTHSYIRYWATALRLPDTTSRPMLSVTLLAHRIISLKLDPAHHPVTTDTLARLFGLGIVAAARRFDRPLPLRFVYALWFSAVALAPRALVPWLAEKLFYPETRGYRAKLLAAFHRKQPEYGMH